MKADAVAIDRRAALAPQIYQQLRQQIIETLLLPGMLLSESEIARRYDVSRQPVREAFIKLAQAGLVQVLPQRGTMVTRISESGIHETRFLREAIEADIVRVVARRVDSHLVTELRRQIEVQRGIDGAELRLFLHLDDMFHRTLAEMAGNASAWALLEDLKSQIDRVRYLSLERGHIASLVSQHTAVVDGIADGNPELAERAMRQHLREVLLSVPLLAGQRPDLFDVLPSRPEMASRD